VQVAPVTTEAAAAADIAAEAPSAVTQPEGSADAEANNESTEK
jgi:hypothetical protein